VTDDREMAELLRDHAADFDVAEREFAVVDGAEQRSEVELAGDV
jgi:hypothetical protein